MMLFLPDMTIYAHPVKFKTKGTEQIKIGVIEELPRIEAYYIDDNCSIAIKRTLERIAYYSK